MKRIHLSLGSLRVKVKMSAQDTTMSRIKPINHKLRLAQIEEERRALLTRY